MSTKKLISQWAKVPAAMGKEFIAIAKSNPELLADRPVLQQLYNDLVNQFPNIALPTPPRVPAVQIPYTDKLANYEALITANASLVTGLVAELSNPTVNPTLPDIASIISTSQFSVLNSAISALNVADTAVEIAFTAEKTATDIYTAAREVGEAAQDIAAPAAMAAAIQVVITKAPKG